MIKLTITEKGGEPKALSFDKEEVSIGRVSGNDIVLPKGNVSKRHTKLSLRHGQIEISDLKSTNGTYVNGRKIAEPMLLSGTDRVYVGDFLITLDGLDGAEAHKQPPPPPPPRTGSGVGRVPPLESTSQGGEEEEESVDEEEAPLAARPPRATGRLPVPPPPPPPRRAPTPLASEALDDESVGDLAAPSAREVAAADEAGGAAGLFERRSAEDDHGGFDVAGGRGTATGRRPGAALPPEAFVPERESPAASQPGAGAEGGPPDVLDLLLADPAVTQIVIASPESAYVDRGAGLVPLATGLGDANTVADTLWRIANAAVPPPPPDNPVVDVRLPDGTRVAAVFPPAAPRGIAGVLRKPTFAERTLGDLCPSGARELQTVLEAAVATQRNILCTGEAAAVTALVSALAGAVPGERRAVSVGAALGRSRTGWTDFVATADVTQLVRVAMALRPQHLFLAEGLGLEAPDVLLAAARGQEGLVIALPARTSAEGLARLEALARPAAATGGLAASSAAPLVATTIDLVAHAVTGSDGAARVVELSEPAFDEGSGRLRAEAVASWRSDDGRRGGANGKLEVEGVSARLGAAMGAAGGTLPASLVRGK